MEEPRIAEPTPSFGMTAELAHTQLSSQRAATKQIETAIRGGVRGLVLGLAALMLGLASSWLEVPTLVTYAVLGFGVSLVIASSVRLFAALMLSRRRPR